MRNIIKRLLYTFCLIITCSVVNAQSLDQAKKLYNEGKYEEAKPVFERLVKRTPSNSSYNHWYGVCCFKTGDIEEAEKYLTIAVKKRIQESFLYMGDLYYMTYRFEQSIEMYEEYISIISRKKQNTDEVSAKLNLAKKGRRMLERVEQVQVIDSVVVNKNSFLSAYQLSEDIGSLHTYGDFFNTNDSVYSTVFMNQKEDRVFYAKKNRTNGKYSLHTQSKLIDRWSDEKILPPNINSENYDENYPFVLTDGTTIYYASNNSESIGGYDLFVTRYSINTDSYLTPEQLGMPYNSIYNDYMMVIDEDKDLGWFVSDRYQPENKVCIYLFIPDEARTRIEDDDFELKRAMATLQSIKKTWMPEVDYSDMVKLAYTGASEDNAPNRDFEFVINDKIIYYTLEEFDNSNAKSLYEKVISIKKEIKETEEQLEALRLSYSKGYKDVSARILELEENLYNLQLQPDDLEKKARNAEIIYLRNHK